MGDGSLAGSGPEESESLRTFGAVVKAFRKRAELTQEQLAPKVRYSPQTIASIEQGRRLPPDEFVERAEKVLDGFGALREAARHVARRPGIASWFRQWAKLEKEALSLNTYESRVVPGLLQTESYTRAVVLNVPPPPPEEEVEQRVAARMARQEILRRASPIALSFILEQAVLERRTGGADVTRELVDHLLEVSEWWHVELQLMPLHQPCHAGLDGSVSLLETPEHQWLGYSEGQKTGQLISGAKELSVLHQRYAKMRSQALTPEDSASLLKRMRGAL
jgi:transcriptional regulator with XRE-family HTH domain